MAKITPLKDGGKIIELSLADIAQLANLTPDQLSLDNSSLVLVNAEPLISGNGTPYGVRILLFERGWDS